jgi:hypothetical protein
LTSVERIVIEADSRIGLREHLPAPVEAEPDLSVGQTT